MKEMCFNAFVFSFLLLIPSFVGAQDAVTIPIETDDFALVLQTGEQQRLSIVYFGQKLNDAGEYAAVAGQHWTRDDNAAIYNHAYTPSGSWNLVEPALQLEHADGNTSTDLQYVSHRVEKPEENVWQTSVTLKDPVYEVEVTLFYKAYRQENVIEQWSVIRNGEPSAIVLEKYASANLYLTGDRFYLRHYHGGWAREMKPEETLLTAGIKTLDSKLGARANLFQPPTFSLSVDRPATEDEGKVLFGTLAWSGNFKIDFEVDLFRNLRLIAGINPHASEYALQSGGTFTTPAFIYTYSDHGKAPASRNLHRWARKYRVLDGAGERLTLLNNWEATYFDFDENKLVSLFQGAKELGVDLFLLDDGWFANKYPRNSDRAGLGDWQENRQKLPHGIVYLVEEATKAGVKFGIWVEPEMVNPKSELYEQHPDWVIRQPERPEKYFRNQLVLDLSNPEVQDFVFGVLDKLFTENPEIAFIKWDCNSVIYNAHSAYLEKTGQKQSHLYVDYVRGLYDVLDRIRKKYPSVPMMLCSGGGGRVDYGALQYFTEFWLSDNTDPWERIFMQWEYSYFFPAITHCNHVTDWSKVGIKYRTDVAMMGKLGYDIVVDELSETDLEFSQNAVKTYESISDVVWHGDLYRLVSPWENPFASVMTVSEDQGRAVMFNYAVSSSFQPLYSEKPVPLRGLDPAKKYRVQELNVYPGTRSFIDEEAVYSGDFLMKVGLNPIVNLRRRSVILELRAVD